MKRTRCTARIEHGRSKTKAHGVTADCTRVRIYNETGQLLATRWVCHTCRERMRLPDRDIDFRPGQTEVGDEIEYREGEWLSGDDGMVIDEDGFRLP
jgi:hypothetical protein